MATKKTTDINELWLKCQNNLRKQFDSDDDNRHIYNVWYADIKMESYDPKTRTLILQVPSNYVCEYIEYFGGAALYTAIHSSFGRGTRLFYHVVPPEPSFADIATYMQRMAHSQHDLHHIRISNAKQRLMDGLKYYLKDKEVKWLPGIEGYKCYGYDRVVEWLTDNHKRGLLCVGTPGTGKTLICEKILPILIGNGSPIKCVNATELHDRLEELKKEQVVVIDDLGKEPRKHYGDIDQSFFELCDNAEKTGNILIITTNLSTNSVDDPRYPDSIEHRYGKEVFSRLQAITNVAIFEGEDMR